MQNKKIRIGVLKIVGGAKFCALILLLIFSISNCCKIGAVAPLLQQLNIHK